MKPKNIAKLENARAAIYTRVSTTEQKDGTSLDDQEVLCLECARRYSMTVVKIFKEDRTAMKPNKRPMFNEMMKMVENGQIDAISYYLSICNIYNTPYFAREMRIFPCLAFYCHGALFYI